MESSLLLIFSFTYRYVIFGAMQNIGGFVQFCHKDGCFVLEGFVLGGFVLEGFCPYIPILKASMFFSFCFQSFSEH